LASLLISGGPGGKLNYSLSLKIKWNKVMQFEPYNFRGRKRKKKLKVIQLQGLK
jgi:hypothetical protein